MSVSNHVKIARERRKRWWQLAGWSCGV